MRFPSISLIFLSMGLSTVTALTVRGAPQNSAAQLQMRSTDIGASLQHRDLDDVLEGPLQSIQTTLDSLLSSSPIPSSTSTQNLEELVSELNDLDASVGSPSTPIPSLLVSAATPSSAATNTPSTPTPASTPQPTGTVATTSGGTPTPTGTAATPGTATVSASTAQGTTAASTSGPQGSATISA